MLNDYGTLPPTEIGIRRLPINDFDLAAITHDVNNWQSHGKFAAYDIAERRQGVARVCLENLAAADGSLMVFEIHKLGKKGFLRTKVFWVVQLYSTRDAEDTLERRGCVWGKTCVSAIHEAHVDVKHGFISIADFAMATSASA